MFKKFCIGFLSITLAVIIAAGALVYVIDPFNVYRADKDMTKIIYQMPYYQNIGIAKYTEYDTLISGTSMTQNFRANWFDKKLGCRAIRLSFDGGIVSDFEALLKTATENNKNLKTVYFGLDNYLITADSKLNDVNDRIPEYQLDGNPFTNIKYLLNKDVIFNYIPTYFSYKNYPDYDFYEMHAWDYGVTTYSGEKLLNGYMIPEKQDKAAQDSFMEPCEDFLNAFEPIIKQNPNIQFVLFAPPYSILYWHKLMQEGSLDATIYAMDYAYGKLLNYGNVRMFYFQSDFEKITDFDKYKDPNHYSSDYNRFMLDCFVSGEMEVTSENYRDVLQSMKKYAESYDYDSILKAE